jgi:hypothetical protein
MSFHENASDAAIRCCLLVSGSVDNHILFVRWAEREFCCASALVIRDNFFASSKRDH